MSEEASYENTPRDRGLVAHRYITYLVGLTSTISAVVLTSFIGDVREGKEKLIRFESIPAKLDKIMDKVENIDGRTAQSEWRLNELEKNQPTTKRR